MTHRLFTLILILSGILFVPFGISAAPLSEADGIQIQTALAQKKIQGVSLDLNVRIHVPTSENPYIPEEEENADLFATVIRPNTANKKLPTILIASGYTRIVSALAPLVIPRGYNFVVMDLRGTGSAGGEWTALDLVEQYDVRYVIDEWIPSQSWSDGKTGIIGLSYLSIITVLAAGLVDVDAATGEPVHLKAMAPISFMSDTYQGAAGLGGNVNIELLSTWVTGTNLLAALPPLLYLGEDGYPADAEDLREAQEIWLTHIRQIPKDISWLMNIDYAVDGLFWHRKSPMIYWPIKPKGGWGFYEGDHYAISSKLPMFIGTGWFDMFTRGVLNYYQYGLSRHSDGDKAMIVGEWGHAGACAGLGVPAMETFQLQLRWFDWKIKGKDDCFMKEFPVLLRVMGEKRWRAEKSWPLPESRLEKKTLFLSQKGADPIEGDWFTAAPDNQLYTLAPEIGPEDIEGDLPVLNHLMGNDAVLHGALSKSSQRWLYGGMIEYSTISKFIFGTDIDSEVFWEDERADEQKVLTFTTAPLEKDMEIAGPLLLKFWSRTQFPYPLTQFAVNQMVKAMKAALGVESNLPLDLMNEKNVQWVAELNDVFPDGQARNMTSGWLMASHRQYNPKEDAAAEVHALDPGYVPFDPFYERPDKHPKLIRENELYQYAVELWPTCNVFKAGHRIRLSLSASDFPHLLPILRPSSSTIVIDDNHTATLEFTSTNKSGEGKTWKWIGPPGNQPDTTFSNYLLTHRDTPDPDSPIPPDETEPMAVDEPIEPEAATETGIPASGSSGGGCFIDLLR